MILRRCASFFRRLERLTIFGIVFFFVAVFPASCAISRKRTTSSHAIYPVLRLSVRSECLKNGATFQTICCKGLSRPRERERLSTCFDREERRSATKFCRTRQVFRESKNCWHINFNRLSRLWLISYAASAIEDLVVGGIRVACGGLPAASSRNWAIRFSAGNRSMALRIFSSSMNTFSRRVSSVCLASIACSLKEECIPP